jgi:hypothetical protein
MSVLKPLKRFIICYKWQTEDGIKKNSRITIAPDEEVAVAKISDKFGIPNKKIAKDAEKEGWVFCNEVYNPNNEEIIAKELEKMNNE